MNFILFGKREGALRANDGLGEIVVLPGAVSAWRSIRRLSHSFSQSAQRGAGSLPQGMMGTVEMEFFGLPSISLSV